MSGSAVHSVRRSLNTVECSHEVQLAFGGHILVVMGEQELKAS
jgi:hypothetical protein